MAISKFSSASAAMLMAACATASSPCNSDVAVDEASLLSSFSAYMATTSAVTTRAITPTSRGSSPTITGFHNPWVEIAQIGVDYSAWGKKRDMGFECLDGDVCLDGGATMTPWCWNRATLDWYNEEGYSGSLLTWDYTTPDGEEGNTLNGPCPGGLYEDSAAGGCSRANANNLSDASATSGSVTRDWAPAATHDSASIEDLTFDGQTTSQTGSMTDSSVVPSPRSLTTDPSTDQSTATQSSSVSDGAASSPTGSALLLLYAGAGCLALMA